MSDRKHTVPFDPHYFERRAKRGIRYSASDAFRHIYQTNLWAGPESPSGLGAGRRQTETVRAALSGLLAELEVRTLLDLPCGDFNWMALVSLGAVHYVGGDLLLEHVESNLRRFQAPNRTFLVLDITHSPLPASELLLCRDCFVHLSFADIMRALTNIKRSQISYLFTTTFVAQNTNEDILTGDWRPLNLERAPFHLPTPRKVVSEECTEGKGVFADKCLGLWSIGDL